jgi:5-methylcytosine-specific restriction endonuclease McrA
MARKTPAKKVAKRKGTPRTPPYVHYPEWTISRFFGFLRSALRSAFNRYPVKWAVLRAAQRAYEGTDKRIKWEYQCAKCGGWFKAKEVSVDHVVPAGSLNTFEDLAGFAERLFCGPDGLQVLHKECHAAKTAEERANK